jgi:hypothetical protein
MGEWFLSMLALSRRAGSTNAPNTALDPWSGVIDPTEKERLQEALWRVEPANSRAQGRATRRRLAATKREVSAALLDAVGVLGRPDRLLDLQAPEVLVALATGKALDLTPDQRRQALQLDGGLRPVAEACAARGVDLGAVWSWCWQAWSKEGRTHWPPSRWAQDAPTPGRASLELKTLWQALPPELLDQATCTLLFHWPGVWGWLTEPVWARWLEVVEPTRRTLLGAHRVFAVLPEDLAVRALKEGRIDALDREIRAVLWARMPERLSLVIDELALASLVENGPLTHLVWSAPDDLIGDLVGRAQRWIADPAHYPGAEGWVWRWLASVVERRGPRWRDAFTLLSERRARLGAAVDTNGA